MFTGFLINFLVFIFGLCIGSFLNCVIYRLESKKSLKGRSFCPHCKHNLGWQDLIPVFSFLFLKGKCRYCKKSISWQYPLVEIATGLIFLIIFNFQFSTFNEFSIFQFINLLFLFYVASVLIVIFVYDLKYYLIPDKILFPAIAITFIYRFLDFGNLNLFRISDFGFRISAIFSNFLFAAFIASGFFLVIFLISAGRWLGFGDVKLAVLMGLLLGLPNVLVALFLAFFFGAIIGVGLIVLNKKNLKSEVPFGPFLITGTFIALFWGSQMIQLYFSIFV
jgi:prepilin signal peptidase PulO-like enzyme (type II secretory pathway)